MTMTPRRFQARQARIWLVAATAVLALALLPAAASADHPYDVLIVKADGGNNPFALESALQAQPEVSNVSVFDASAFTPLLSLIDDYDVVIPYSNTDYASATTLGDRLANYVDAGGVVVPLAFDGISTSPNRTLGGRWITDEYRPWLPGATVDFANRSLGAYDATHPIFQGVTALSAWYRISDLTTAPGATLLASWDSGAPLVAVKGRVVGVNARLGSEEWSGDFARLIVNAANWLYPHPEPPPPPPPAPPAPPMIPADIVKPVITALSLDPKSFEAAGRRGAAGRGTEVTVGLSEAAQVRVTFQRRAAGRRVAGRCSPPRRTNRTAPRCLRWRTVKGSIERAAVAGPNELRFSGRLRGRKLAPGAYRMQLRATDAAGNRSSVKRARFRVLAP